MKRCFLFVLLILTFILSAHAQKLSYGGKPKLFESKDGIKAHEVKFPNGILVRKFNRKTEDDKNGFFEISKGRNALGEIPASISIQSATDNFFAFYGDLDKNKSAELVVVDFDGQSLGLGVSYYTINIFPDFQTKSFQTPLTFQTTEFGKDGTFVYDAKANETLMLLTEWGGPDNLSDPKRGDGLYFVGRFFRYQNGLLKPAADKPIYARRYLYSFENERFRTDKSPLRPFLWLNSPKSQKLKIDPEFSLKSLTSEIGVVEKVETINEIGKGDDEGEKVEIKQFIVKLNSGETKTIILSKNPENILLESDKGKIFPEIFGVLPSALSLPMDLNPTLVLGNLEGRKITLNTYQPYEFDESKKTRYKILFHE
ncbi:MAG: hypothetical protein AAB336_05910 [Acidobacteriota bacterium]